ncbi:hypothetical protein [Sediminibacterium sp.]|uniref:hypothetical protein n=1 Tax=Sediminibacterium sp. TaxID=1917865 RepID=UPI003F7200AA
MKKILLLMVISFVASNLNAQQTVWGYLKDSISNEPIELASVTNTNKKQTVITNNNGLFKVEISKDDILSISAVGYRYYTFIYSGVIAASDTIELYLVPISRNLNNVTVQNSGISQYTLDSLERDNEFKEAMISPPVKAVELSNSGAGFGISLNRLTNREKSKRKAVQLFNNSEKEAYINYRFSAAIVKKYSGLKNEALQGFVQRHRPTYDWLRKHPKEEDVKYYINDKLKADRKSNKN